MKQSTLGLFGRSLSLVSSIVIIPLMISLLGVANYGSWLVISSISNWIILFNSGVSNSMRNKFTEYIVNGELSKLSSAISWVLFLFVLFGVVLYALILTSLQIWNLNLDALIPKNNIEYSLLKYMIMLVTGAGIGRLILSPIKALFFSFNSSGHIDLLNGVGNFIFLLIIYLNKFYSLFSLQILLFLQVGIPLFVFGFYSIYRYRDLMTINFSSNRVNLSELMSGSGDFLIVEWSGVLFFATMSWVINFMLGPESVVNFMILERVFSVPLILSAVLMLPIWNYFTTYWKVNNFMKIRKLIIKGRLISVSLIIFSLFLMLIFLNFEVLSLSTLPISVFGSYFLYHCLRLVFQVDSKFLNGIGDLKRTRKMAMVMIIIYWVFIFNFSNLVSDLTDFIILIVLIALPTWLSQYIQTKQIISEKKAIRNF